MGDFWSARIFFFQKPGGQDFFLFFSLFSPSSSFFSLLLVLHAIFSFQQALAGIFFQNQLPPPSKVKWSAPYALLYTFFRLSPRRFFDNVASPRGENRVLNSQHYTCTCNLNLTLNSSQSEQTVLGRFVHKSAKCNTRFTFLPFRLLFSRYVFQYDCLN